MQQNKHKQPVEQAVKCHKPKTLQDRATKHTDTKRPQNEHLKRDKQWHRYTAEGTMGFDDAQQEPAGQWVMGGRSRR